MTRRSELEANLTALRSRLADACSAAGRDPGEITVVAVTKKWPASDVRLLAELGVTDVGENRDQEAAPKARELGDSRVTWHFLGQLQTNKCRSVASYADVVHSVDRARLVSVLGREARRAGRTLCCLVQADLEAGENVERGGVSPADAPPLGDEIAGREGLTLGGVMGMAPQGVDPAAAFTRLAGVSESLRKAHPGATMISAGMSGDLESAIAHGATHIRIGTALLGARTADVR